MYKISFVPTNFISMAYLFFSANYVKTDKQTKKMNYKKKLDASSGTPHLFVEVQKIEPEFIRRENGERDKREKNVQ